MMYVIEDVKTGMIYFSHTDKHIVDKIFKKLGKKFKDVFHEFKLAEYNIA